VGNVQCLSLPLGGTPTGWKMEIGRFRAAARECGHYRHRDLLAGSRIRNYSGAFATSSAILLGRISYLAEWAFSPVLANPCALEC
jgi:hypothetical protein